MTGNEMISTFGLNYSSEINNAVPGFLNSEILSFLNQAQEDIIFALCEGSNFDYIEPLRTEQSINSFSPHSYISKTYTVEADPYFYPIKLYVKFLKNGVSHTAECRDFRKKKNDVGKYIDSDGNKVMFNIPIWFVSENDLVVMVDSYSTLTSGRFQYIAVPDAIVESDDEITHIVESFHSKIVDRAVTIAIETMTNPRIQTQPVINQ